MGAWCGRLAGGSRSNAPADDAMARQLWCSLCNESFEVVAGNIPPICPACKKPTTWWTGQLGPDVKYELSMMDRKFLRTLRISPD